MSKVVLISCVSKKLSHKAKAEDLYVSPLFRYNLAYARQMKPDRIFILSAKYGLLNPKQAISPYDETLNRMPSSKIRLWADDVLENLRKTCNLKTDEFIFLAGEKYRKYLLPHIARYRIPLEGFSIGRQLSYLKQEVKK